MCSLGGWSLLLVAAFGPLQAFAAEDASSGIQAEVVEEAEKLEDAEEAEFASASDPETAEAGDQEQPEPEEPQRVTSPRRLLDSGGFPPIGMHLDHPQEKRHWTFSYRFVRMLNEGLLDGRDSVDPADLLGNPWTEVSTSQVDDVHIMGVAYAPLERLTFELSLPYMNRSMDLITAAGTRSVSAKGIGDARFVFIVPFIENLDQATDLTFGFTFPTGKVDETDENGERLPYSMQLGSGTWDLVWGVAYTGRNGRLGWGGEVNGVYRIGHNHLGYTQGTLYEASAWLTVMASEWMAVTGRMGWSRRTNVGGSDPALDPLTNPANDPYKQAWNRLEMGPGANFLIPVLGGQRLAVEALFPVLQSLSGPQVKRDWTLTAGFQWLY